MVRYYSDDGVFDGPLDKVWKLIEAHGDPKNKIHAAMLSAKGTPQPDGSIRLECSIRGPDGKPANHVWIIRAHPPRSQTVDFAEGPMKGSWMTSVYLPEGNKTRVITTAEWRIQGVTDEATLRKYANDFFDNGYEEDNKFLRAMM